jgi:hypothetical protein
MIDPSSSKACTNCATARRKCGKQRPHCLRCRTRGRTCYYPHSRPTNFIRLPDTETLPSPTPSNSTEVSIVPPSPLDTHFPTLETHLASYWFASPETWLIDAVPPTLTANSSRFSSDAFDRILAKVLEWLTQWSTDGSCPLIHQQLYRTCFPSSIQDAYLALSTWTSKSPMSAQIVHRIVEEKATKLVSIGMIQHPLNVTDALDNLARVQALLIYQVLCFSSTDLALRSLADRHVPMLEAWVTLLMAQFSRTLGLSSPLYTCSPPESPPGKALWCAWIMAESVRRIWLVTAGLQGLYKLFTNSSTSDEGLQTPCLGGTLFTSRKGFWEAPSARVWEKSCSERYAGLVRLTETEKLFSMVPREEISEFAKVVLECTFGVEWCEERWGA